MDGVKTGAWFLLLTGLGQEEGTRWLPLWEQALQDIRGRMRPEVQMESLETAERVSAAAGALAAYRYSLIRYGAHGAGSFRSDSLSVEPNALYPQQAKAILDELLNDTNDLFADTGFAFTRI